MNNNFIKVENQDKPATRKQLWALFAASRKCGEKHDYRGDNLTMQQASELLQKFNARNVVSKIGVGVSGKTEVSRIKKTSLEEEFISFMSEKIESIIATARQALNIKSIVEDDPSIFTDASKRKKYAFFGFGCGISIIKFDKRSKVGKKIEELSDKHRTTTFLEMFLKGFSAKEIKHFESVGCPLSALYYQDYQIGRSYMSAVMSFMAKKGVKNLRVLTFDD